MPARILVGTASWSDPEFVRDWYPKGLPARERLAYYAARFELVELNSSFYAIPKQGLVEQWARVAPANFVFDVKLHKLLSRHSCGRKFLPDDLQRTVQTTAADRVILTPDLETAVVTKFLEAIRPLERSGQLGALLLQLSPSFSPRHHQLTELDSLLHQLSPRPVAIELRNRGWVEGQLLDATGRYFREHNVTFVSVDAPKSDHFNVMPAFDVMTNASFAYLRLHGRNERGYLSGKSVAERFDYDYSDAELSELAERVQGLAEQAGQVHVVFNNNRSDYAPSAALRFRMILGQMPTLPAGRVGMKKVVKQQTLGF